MYRLKWLLLGFYPDDVKPAWEAYCRKYSLPPRTPVDEDDRRFRDFYAQRGYRRWDTRLCQPAVCPVSC